MNTKITMQPIGRVCSDFKEKFGIPRQSGRAPSLLSEIHFSKDIPLSAFNELESFSHIWVVFLFSACENQGWNPTVRPPRLGGNKRVGVFASRSPFRPNSIGLSCVKLESIQTTENGVVLTVSGADMLNGTPVLDIKPYIPYADCQPQAIGGYADEKKDYKLKVEFPSELLNKIPLEKQRGILECLADDPRPSYQDDPSRTYGMAFDRFQIKFRVHNDILTVETVE
jgi:tRNA-Thr(GGU) m(6)t(6)A37 methyltransferase TsaA